MIEYGTYTAKDVRAWLYARAENGISEHIISKVRANALLHCPYVEDDTILLFVAKDGEQVVGYTAQFPEHYVRPDLWFMQPTTLYVKPEYEGEFIGYTLNEKLHAVKGEKLVMGIDMAPASAMIDKLLGMKYIKVDRSRWILNRKLTVRSLRNVGSAILEPYRQYKQKKAIAKLGAEANPNVRVEYTNFIDAEAYSFIVKHSKNDTFLHSQEMLNWMMHYPFVTESVLHGEERNICEFGGISAIYRKFLCKVYVGENLIGIYMLTQHVNNVTINLLYTDETHDEDVYCNLVRTLIQLKPTNVISLYKNLDTYIQKTGVMFKHYMDKINMTYDKSLVLDTIQLQGVDGDMFV